MINDSITMRSLSPILIVYSIRIPSFDGINLADSITTLRLCCTTVNVHCTNGFTYHYSDCHSLLPHYLLNEKIIIERYNLIALKYTYWWSKSLSIICFVTAFYIYINMITVIILFLISNRSVFCTYFNYFTTPNFGGNFAVNVL